MITLSVGDKAPDFTGTAYNGQKISLKDYKGKKLALYFYPQDDTPACTVQACNIRDNYTELLNNGIEILGVSPDDAESHEGFSTKYQLPFPLLADPRHGIIKKYGVWGQKNLYGNIYEGLLRTTFLIDEKGIVKAIIKRPKTKDHAAEIIKKFS